MRLLTTAYLTTALTSILALSACQGSDTSETKSETSTVSQSGVTEATILAASPKEWVTHGGNYAEQRHSRLNTITADTVKELGLAFSYDLGTSRGIEATPIVHDGIMYVTSTWNIVTALNAKTGEELWVWEPEIDKKQAANACCDVVNRGVAIWGDKVFTATIDGRLVALDRKTGDVVWDVLTIDKSKPYTMTGAPRVIKGKVIIGNGGAELGVRGYVGAFDAETGKQIWRFYTVPGNPADGFETETMKMAADTWTGEYWAAGGGGTVWDSMAYDAELDLLYVGVGNGSPWNQAIRSPEGGDNLFLSSIVAVRPDTGEYVWHYQTTPGETWDYTATQHMILADLEIEGALRKVIMQAPKNGFFYVIDRETGEFISGENFVPVNWATHIDKETGRPVETAEARYQGKDPFLQLPGPLGAHNWHPMSYSPDTGLVYIPAQEAPWVYQEMEGYKQESGAAWNTGTNFIAGMLPTDKATFKALRSMLKGRLLAWDPVAQKPAWTFEHGGPWNGGILSTAGNLVFQGTADAHFAAYNAKTGERLWRDFTQTGIVAAPISYEIDGEQYIAVASGWGGSYALGFGGVMPTGSAAKVGRVLVYKAGGTATLPNLKIAEYTLPTPPESTAPEVVIKAGAVHYANRCGACHGDQAYSMGLVPNLRASAAIADSELWNEIIIGGALAENGMPDFGTILTKEDAEAVREYVIFEANSDRDKDFYESVSIPEKESLPK